MRTSYSQGLAPKKSLALQVGWTALPDVAPVLSRSDDDAVASLVDPVAPTPLVVAKPAVSSMVGMTPPAESLVSPADVVVTAPSQEPSDVAMVASEGPAQSVPLVAQTTTFDAGRTERDAAGRSPTSTSQAHPNAVMMASA